MIPFLFRRSRWMILGWVAKRVGRAGLTRSVDRAAAKVEDRLPAPVANSLKKLPVDLTRAGGVAVLAGQGARSAGNVAKATGLVARSAANATGRFGRSRRADIETVADRIHHIRDEIAIESDEARRRIHSDMLRETEGDEAALNALLDLRPVDPVPLPEVPPEIRSGRNRHVPALPSPPVNRVRRTYRQATKPWERPVRRR